MNISMSSKKNNKILTNDNSTFTDDDLEKMLTNNKKNISSGSKEEALPLIDLMSVGKLKNPDQITELGIELKKIRTEKKLKAKDIGYHSGTNESYISLIENGKRNLTVDNLFAILNCLDYEIKLVPKSN